MSRLIVGHLHVYKLIHIFFYDMTDLGEHLENLSPIVAEVKAHNPFSIRSLRFCCHL